MEIFPEINHPFWDDHENPSPYTINQKTIMSGRIFQWSSPIYSSDILMFVSNTHATQWDDPARSTMASGLAFDVKLAGADNSHGPIRSWPDDCLNIVTSTVGRAYICIYIYIHTYIHTYWHRHILEGGNLSWSENYCSPQFFANQDVEAIDTASSHENLTCADDTWLICDHTVHAKRMTRHVGFSTLCLPGLRVI